MLNTLKYNNMYVKMTNKVVNVIFIIRYNTYYNNIIFIYEIYYNYNKIYYNYKNIFIIRYEI